MPQQEAYCRSDEAFSLCGQLNVAPCIIEVPITPILCKGRERHCELPLLGSAAMHCHGSSSRLPQQCHCLHQSIN